jgi:hypothetical protein
MFGITSSGVTQAIASLDLHLAHLTDLSHRLEEASDVVYEETRHRFDTEGDGDWPQLAESTIAKKEAQGYGEPARILYAEGNLYESATSPAGPYSLRMHIRTTGKQSIVMLVDFENGGWQIPTVLAEGNDRLPARPIWPPTYVVRDRVAAILMAGL